MPEALFYYLYFISLGGFIFLLFFSILSFINSEGLEIKQDHHINSGVLLLTNCIIYLIIAIFLKINQSKSYVKSLTL